MLTEMALSSDRMRFKDKIIANIAKAIKGIQEAVFFKNRTTVDNSPLVLRNNDRQCHKLCENLDHVFLHGLRQHSHGYWKVVTEYTHKNAVREIKNLRNVTTDLGRARPLNPVSTGRAWIFMALNDTLLESYIRCITQHTKMLKKHYAKDALLLDQQQMSVLLTLTSGLECAVFQLEYDLPYLDLTAYPPRTRTASEIEEEDEGPSGAARTVAASLRPSTETAASTPESAKALTDSDTASLSSLDTPALCSARISSVSMDSGFPGDILTQQSSKQRSVTPIDTLSVSSHGSGGEPDRLTRLENIVNRTESGMEVEGGGLEVIRMKGGKKLAPGAKKKKGASAKETKRPVSQTSVDSVSASAPVSVARTCSATDLEGESVGKNSSCRNSLYGKNPQNETNPHRTESPQCEENLCGSSVNNVSERERFYRTKDGDSSTDSMTTVNHRQGEDAGRTTGKKVERLAAETKDSFADGFAQLDSAVASIRATTTTLHSAQTPTDSVKTLACSSSFHNSDYERPDLVSQQSSSRDWENVYDPSAIIACDHDNSEAMREPNAKVPGTMVNSPSTMSALAELESKCALLCRPLSPDENIYGGDVAESLSLSEQSDQNLSNAQGDQLLSEVKSFGNSDVPAKESQEEEEEEEVDFYSVPSKAGSSINKTQSYGQIQDYVDYISGHHGDDTLTEERVGVDEEGNVVETERSEWRKDYALRLDNNTKLQIMLDVFTHDDEEFLKMFVSREGHSEGEQKVTFVLVTNHALYLLCQRDSDRKFETELAIPLKDLSFLSLSLNKQIVNIESTGPNRRKERVWLTPGDHLLAQQILDCLEEAMKGLQQPTSVRSHFSVGSDEPLQIIALRKYIARDSNCQELDVEIEDYSLVFWEDTQSNKNRPTSTAREGTMLLRVSDPFKGHVWKPVFVVLRDFMLCLFADKTDNKPQQYVRLGGEQCVGCRLATTQDRPHCIEIILAKGGSWFLSVASEQEVSSWRQSLCLAVSEGMQDSSNLSCLPCVSVVTGHKLLLCHEDVQTKFCRTIASAKIEEITALTVDPEVNTYCIVEFESQESGVVSERWVLYFNSPLEMDRFVQALSSVWHQVYQIPLSGSNIEDLPLQKHCQDQVFLLQRMASLK